LQFLIRKWGIRHLDLGALILKSTLKMKIIKFSFALVALIALTIVSCEKNESQDIISDNVYHKTYTNPHDTVGDDHNAMLDDFYATYSLTGPQVALSTKITIANDYLDNAGSPYNLDDLYAEVPQSEHTQGLLQDSTFSISDAQTEADSMLNNNLMSEAVHGYVSALFDSLDTHTSVTQLEEMLVNLESVIGNDNSLTSNEKRALLHAMASSKASVGYQPTYVEVYGVPWYEKDILGAGLAISSGAVEYGALFGPWGAVVAFVGVSAVASMVP